MAAKRPVRRALLVSFSGLDGAGKTAQITALRESISYMGLRSRQLIFWDDVVVGRRWREEFVHKVFASERGIGTPQHPVERRDKNMRAGYLTVARHLLYLVDALHLRLLLMRRKGADVIVADRYIYDELANLPLEHRMSAALSRMLLWIAPRPQLALLLDVEPEIARARKPEYPLDFLRESRNSYLLLTRMIRGITVIPPLPIEETRHMILSLFLRSLSSDEQQGQNEAAA